MTKVWEDSKGGQGVDSDNPATSPTARTTYPSP